MLPYGDERIRHARVCEVGGMLWQQFLFRDYLHAHPDKVARPQAMCPSLYSTR
jgi:hypothetical protein